MKTIIRAPRLLLPGLLLMLGLSTTACGSQPDEAATAARAAAAQDTPATAAMASTGAYAFDRPEVSLALPADLKEISGITVLADGRLAAVQDEVGTLFILNAETGAVEERIAFEEEGDFEGVELAGDRLFVLRSNGTLAELQDWAGGAPQVRVFETGLKGKNDTEGLAYDRANNRLLIACKEDPGSGLDDKMKAVYAFDLSSGQLSAQPVFVMDADALKDQIPGKGNFKPSAIAVHPSSGDVYVLSSVARAVVVVGSDGQLREVTPLPEATFEQPEGLAFTDDGDLFVSSEGVDGPGMLYRFRPSGGS